MPKQDIGGNAGGLFLYLKTKYRLNTDGDLADFTETARSVISEIRKGKREINEVMLVRICNKTGISLKKAQALIAHRN